MLRTTATIDFGAGGGTHVVQRTYDLRWKDSICGESHHVPLFLRSIGFPYIQLDLIDCFNQRLQLVKSKEAAALLFQMEESNASFVFRALGGKNLSDNEVAERAIEFFASKDRVAALRGLQAGNTKDADHSEGSDAISAVKFEDFMRLAYRHLVVVEIPSGSKPNVIKALEERANSPVAKNGVVPIYLTGGGREKVVAPDNMYISRVWFRGPIGDLHRLPVKKKPRDVVSFQDEHPGYAMSTDNSAKTLFLRTPELHCADTSDRISLEPVDLFVEFQPLNKALKYMSSLWTMLLALLVFVATRDFELKDYAVPLVAATFPPLLLIANPTNASLLLWQSLSKYRRMLSASAMILIVVLILHDQGFVKAAAPWIASALGFLGSIAALRARIAGPRIICNDVWDRVRNDPPKLPE